MCQDPVLCSPAGAAISRNTNRVRDPTRHDVQRQRQAHRGLPVVQREWDARSPGDCGPTSSERLVTEFAHEAPSGLLLGRASLDERSQTGVHLGHRGELPRAKGGFPGRPSPLPVWRPWSARATSTQLPACAGECSSSRDTARACLVGGCGPSNMEEKKPGRPRLDHEPRFKEAYRR